MSDLVFNGPTEFEVRVFIINEETGQAGSATIGLGFFEYPSKQKVKDRIAQFEKEELTGTLEGFRLMTKPEAWEMVMLEKTGERIAMAGSRDWDEI